MTTAISNVANTDIVDLTLEQAGASRTEVFLEEPLLDATKDYMVSCSEFAAPLSEEGMMTYNLATSVTTRVSLTMLSRRSTILSWYSPKS